MDEKDPMEGYEMNVSSIQPAPAEHAGGIFHPTLQDAESRPSVRELVGHIGRRQKASRTTPESDEDNGNVELVDADAPLYNEHPHVKPLLRSFGPAWGWFFTGIVAIFIWWGVKLVLTAINNRHVSVGTPPIKLYNTPDRPIHTPSLHAHMPGEVLPLILVVWLVVLAIIVFYAWYPWWSTRLVITPSTLTYTKKTKRGFFFDTDPVVVNASSIHGVESRHSTLDNFIYIGRADAVIKLLAEDDIVVPNVRRWRQLARAIEHLQRYKQDEE